MRQWIDLVESKLNEELPLPPNLANMAEIVAFVKSNTDWGGGSGDTLMNDYMDDRGEDSDASISIHSADFLNWLTGWVEDRVYDAWGNFMHLFDHGGSATLYRVITAPRDWKPDGRHPGIYWSWDEHAAEAHWGEFGNGNVKWRIKAKVNMNAVDWTATLGMNVQPDYAEEREIRLKDNAPVEILNYERI